MVFRWYISLCLGDCPLSRSKIFFSHLRSRELAGLGGSGYLGDVNVISSIAIATNDEGSWMENID